jgi:hypothetical protein
MMLSTPGREWIRIQQRPCKGFTLHPWKMRQRAKRVAEKKRKGAFTLEPDMSGFKRMRSGQAKESSAIVVKTVRNEYTPMFERFRDELDEHHDRRERIVKASRDITALCKKM